LAGRKSRASSPNEWKSEKRRSPSQNHKSTSSLAAVDARN
jgi:hypothetical protein